MQYFKDLSLRETNKNMFKSMIASISGKRPQVVKPFGGNKDQKAVAFH
ncbi:hypothetical protein HCH_01967 [Hahella chejuensis KCTC 2396]|uniref:Uncharacterized protein n=1 Tax=Hahella chejuensis (strain KCTC 2396) TaxID=349521 RepID=Q2SKM4_HAHCH|nr:hypothetical protein HCH_01967 [Hahella chejuensis KCTC 2396]